VRVAQQLHTRDLGVGLAALKPARRDLESLKQGTHLENPGQPTARVRVEHYAALMSGSGSPAERSS